MRRRILLLLGLVLIMALTVAMLLAADACAISGPSHWRQAVGRV